MSYCFVQNITNNSTQFYLLSDSLLLSTIKLTSFDYLDLAPNISSFSCLIAWILLFLKQFLHFFKTLPASDLTHSHFSFYCSSFDVFFSSLNYWASSSFIFFYFSLNNSFSLNFIFFL